MVNFHWVGGEPVGPDTPSRGAGVEQSNTSIIFDERLVLKVFRRLEPGINPELEMLRFLAAHGFQNIAALEGWFDYSGELMEATLGVMQRFIVDAVDGWAPDARRPDDRRDPLLRPARGPRRARPGGCTSPSPATRTTPTSPRRPRLTRTSPC